MGYGRRKDGGRPEKAGDKAAPGRCSPVSEHTTNWQRDTTSLQHIKGMWRASSSFGGMLPEQIWDYEDIPSEGPVPAPLLPARSAAAGLGTLPEDTSSCCARSPTAAFLTVSP